MSNKLIKDQIALLEGFSAPQNKHSLQKKKKKAPDALTKIQVLRKERQQEKEKNQNKNINYLTYKPAVKPRKSSKKMLRLALKKKNGDKKPKKTNPTVHNTADNRK
jgi:hypothetical protein